MTHNNEKEEAPKLIEKCTPPLTISKADAEHYSWGERCDGWRLVSSNDLSVIHERMPPGTAEVLHRHLKARQFFFVLSGCASMEVNGVSRILRMHEGIEIPPGLPHRIRNESEQACEFLVISQPTTAGDRENLQ